MNAQKKIKEIENNSKSINLQDVVDAVPVDDIKNKIFKTEQKIVFDDYVSSKQKTLLFSSNGLINFYKNPVNKKIIVEIILGKTCISLRLLDWLITNYSKKFDVYYTLGNSSSETYVPISRNFNMWKDYKNQLKSYSKKSFDPFCRRQRVYFDLETYEIIPITEHNDYFTSSYKGLVTTVGQLNFFRWAIENNVIDYAFDNLDKIEPDMLATADKKNINKNKKDKSIKTAKKQLSKNNSASKAHKTKVLVQFS